MAIDRHVARELLWEQNDTSSALWEMALLWSAALAEPDSCAVARRSQFGERTLFAALNATESCAGIVTVARPSSPTATVGPVHEVE